MTPARTQWPTGYLRSPEHPATLHFDSPHSLTDGIHRYPVVEDIPFLRQDRGALRHAALDALDSGDESAALRLLLADQDDWSPTSAPTVENIDRVIDGGISLREAMQLLNFGPVADYFAYRWSDPTFLSGLALLSQHLPMDTAIEQTQKPVLELACGIGHYCRELLLRDIHCIGADVVFAKLFLARRYVAPACRLICFDAAYNFPLPNGSCRAAFCHDAFYFLDRKQHVAVELRRVVGDDGTLMIGHAHNAAADNFSSGSAATVHEYAAMFTDPLLYDDAELTASALENRRAVPALQAEELNKKSSAIAIVSSPRSGSRLDFTVPPLHAKLRINPLLVVMKSNCIPAATRPRFPSERYRLEYENDSRYLFVDNGITEEDLSSLSAESPCRSPHLEDLIRRRILISLPEQW